jgi:hypothetical protein
MWRVDTPSIRLDAAGWSSVTTYRVVTSSGGRSASRPDRPSHMWPRRNRRSWPGGDTMRGPSWSVLGWPTGSGEVRRREAPLSRERDGQTPLSLVHSGGMSPSIVGPLANQGSGAMTGVRGAFIHAPHQLKVEFAMTLPAA